MTPALMPSNGKWHASIVQQKETMQFLWENEFTKRDFRKAVLDSILRLITRVFSMSPLKSKQRIFALICGAGPVGLMLACKLKQYQVPFIIVDKKSHLSTTIKACMLSSRSIDLFDSLGLAEQAIALGAKIRGGKIYDRGTCVLSGAYDEMPYRHPFNLHLGQPYIERILKAYLEKNGIPVYLEHELVALSTSDQGTQATVCHQGKYSTVECDWLIGCDGHSSFVRQHCKLPFEGESFATQYFIANVKLDSSLDRDFAHIFYNDEGFLAVYALPDGMTQIAADIRTHEDSTKPHPPTLEKLQALFDTRCFIRGKLHDAEWLSFYFAHARRVPQSVFKRIILCGDAAHVVSPLTGLGMNTGLQDAVSLAWRLQFLYKKWATPECLQHYMSERQFVLKRLNKLSRVLDRFFLQTDASISEIRNHLIHQTDQIESIRRKQIDVLMQKNLFYPLSPVIRQEGAARESNALAGSLAPDLLYPHLDTCFHTWVYLPASQASLSEKAWLDFLQHYNSFQFPQWLQGLLILPDGIYYTSEHSYQGIAVLEDVHHKIRKALRITQSTLCFIRPDQTISYVSIPADFDQWLHFIQSVYPEAPHTRQQML